jgi:hypothetical protein
MTGLWMQEKEPMVYSCNFLILERVLESHPKILLQYSHIALTATIIIIIIIIALQLFFWALAAFSVSWSYTQSIGLLGRGIGPSKSLYLHTE